MANVKFNCGVRPISNTAEYEKLKEVEEKIEALCDLAQYTIDDEPLFEKLRKLEQAIFDTRYIFDKKRLNERR